MNKYTFQLSLVIASCLLALSFPVYTMFWINPHFTEIITFEKEVNAKQIANHITKMMALDSTNTTLTKESITSDFTEILKEAQLDFDLTKIKVFSSKGEVLYSTDAADIGIFNTYPYFTDIVTKGKIYSMIVRKNEKTLEDEIVTKDVVETYVPLMSDKQFIGAFEIYYDITYSGHSIRKFVERSQIIVLMASLLLLLCILTSSLYAFTYLKKLRKAEKDLQVIKDQMSPLYNFPPDETDE